MTIQHWRRERRRRDPRNPVPRNGRVLPIWAIVALGLLAAPAMVIGGPPDELDIVDETFASDAFRSACQAIAVGPNVLVDELASLTLRSPSLTLEDGVSILGEMEVQRGLPCTDVQQIAEAANDLVLDVCVPPQDFSTVVTVTVCGGSLCDDGVTQGCPVRATVAETMVDLATSTLTATIEVADFEVDVVVDLFPLPEVECTLDFTNAAASFSTTYGVEAICDGAADEVQSLVSFESDIDFDVTGCGLYLGTLLPVLEPAIDDLVEDQARALAEEELVGAWICPAPSAGRP